MRRVCRSSRKVPRELPDASKAVLATQESCQCLISEQKSSRLLGRHSTQATTSRHSFRIPSPVKLGRAGDHPMSKNCFNPVCVPALPFSSPPVSLALVLETNLERASEQTGIFCRSSLVSAAALPLHLPSKAEHLGQGRSPH